MDKIKDSMFSQGRSSAGSNKTTTPQCPPIMLTFDHFHLHILLKN